MDFKKSINGVHIVRLSVKEDEKTVEKDFELEPLTLRDFATALNILKQIDEKSEASDISDAIHFLYSTPFGLLVALSLSASKRCDKTYAELFDVFDVEYSPELVHLVLKLCNIEVEKKEIEKQKKDADKKVKKN